MRWLEAGIVLSAALHAAAFGALGPAERVAARPPVTMEFEPAPAPEEAPEPAAPSEPEPEPEPKVVQRRELAAKPAPTAPTAEPPKTSAAPAHADLTGLTLTNDDGSASWSSAVGSGAPLSGPIGPAHRAEPRAAVLPAAAVAGAAVGPTVVPSANLSHKPEPPPLDGLLRRFYPDGARKLGLSGSAVVIARIDRDGVVRSARLASETGEGFGAACRRTLLGSRWTAPRDREGRQVATEVRYTCRFRAD